MGATNPDNTCNVCHQECITALHCAHKVCVECILKLQNEYKVICPECQNSSNTEDLLFACYKCPRCSILSSEFFLCDTCDNYLCDSCWKDIHSFPPMETHGKAERDDTHQRIICTQLNKAKALDNQIKQKLSQLENSIKTTSLRQAKIIQIRNHFSALHDELARQENAAIQHVHAIAGSEMGGIGST